MVWESSAYRWYLRLPVVGEVGGESAVQNEGPGLSPRGTPTCKGRTEKVVDEEYAPGKARESGGEGTWARNGPMSSAVAHLSDGGQDFPLGLARQRSGRVQWRTEDHSPSGVCGRDNDDVTYFCMFHTFLNLIWWQNKMFSCTLYHLLASYHVRFIVSNFYCYQEDWNEKLCKLFFSTFSMISFDLEA